MSKLYVAYGSNLNLSQMAHRCPGAELAFTGELLGYELTFRRPSRGWTSVANIERVEGARTPVGVWRINGAHERALDSYEGYPYLYTKRNVWVCEKPGHMVRAMAYVLVDDSVPLQAPADPYRETVLMGYWQCELPLDFLQARLAAMPACPQ